jgi:hypothetical protein
VAAQWQQGVQVARHSAQVNTARPPVKVMVRMVVVISLLIVHHLFLLLQASLKVVLLLLLLLLPTAVGR